jgi:hypothetical protein
MSVEDLTGVATWEDPGWRAGAVEWAAGELDRLGLAPAGEPEQPHVRPWSTVIRLPVRGGAVWLKSVGSGSAQEPALLADLAGWVPGRVLPPLAVDATRRLMLLPDGGPTLRATAASSAAEWEAMVAAYAQLQMDLVPHVDEMLAVGVPDLRPARLPQLVRDLLEDDDAMLLDRPEGLTTAVQDRIAGGLGTYAEDCRRLDDAGIPASLQHDDLHDNNVFVGPDGHRFFDWGDATVSHPFLSLLVPLRAAARALEVPSGDPSLFRLRDAYLEPWSAYGRAAELRNLSEVALRIGPPARALTWRRILLGIHPAERVEWDEYVAGWMAEYLEPGSLAPAAPTTS